MADPLARVRVFAVAALGSLALAACAGQTTSEETPTATYGAALEQGERYAFDLYIHCGMDYLGELNGQAWGLAEAPAGHTPETGAGDPVPEGWAVSDQSILGFVTLMAADRIEYSLEDGTVIGIYEPIADTDVRGCD